MAVSVVTIMVDTIMPFPRPVQAPQRRSTAVVSAAPTRRR
jgi:hypothetical protein